MSRPWHGPYRVATSTATGVSATKVYTDDRNPIQVHLHRVTRSPPGFPAGYFWYGSHRKGPGRPPKELQQPGKRPNTNQVDLDHKDKDATLNTPSKKNLKCGYEGVPLSTAPPLTTSQPPQTDSSTAQRTRTRVIHPPRRYQ